MKWLTRINLALLVLLGVSTGMVKLFRMPAEMELFLQALELEGEERRALLEAVEDQGLGSIEAGKSLLKVSKRNGASTSVDR